jgi:hypothetical protein
MALMIASLTCLICKLITQYAYIILRENPYAYPYTDPYECGKTRIYLGAKRLAPAAVGA